MGKVVGGLSPLSPVGGSEEDMRVMVEGRKGRYLRGSNFDIRSRRGSYLDSTVFHGWVGGSMNNGSDKRRAGMGARLIEKMGMSIV
ncbi:MAG: hypothetical protein METHAR1v1_190010 [Methanothrix sp.]|nr:MAG: hypothetical protein METHAR1v1_190010 [Methanothrix sp.]